MKRLILFGLLYAAMLCVARTAGAQTNWLGVDSSEFVNSTTAGPIGSGTTTPFRFIVHAGDGGKFARCGFPLLLTLAPAPGTELTNSLREEIWVSAVSGDTLTVIKRKTSNTAQQAWPSGSYVGIRVSMQVMKQLQDSLRRVRVQFDSLLGVIGPNSFLPSQGGNAGKALTTNGTTLSWTAQPGSVVPVSLGGTGLTVVPAGKMLYAPTTGTMAALSVGSGLTISGGILSATLSSSSTDGLPEGSTNLYYTDARVRAALSATSPLDFTSGVFSMPQASSIAAGYVSALQVTSWDGKQAALSFPLAANFGGTGQSTLAAALNAMFVASGADSTGTADTVVLGKTHAGYRWVGIGGGGGGAGTVTSIRLDSIPNFATWSPSSITTSGTFTPTLDVQQANKIFAGPATGANATPTFRAMVTADIPNSIVTNAKLASSSVTVTAGTGLTGGGAVSLGSAVTLTNDGVRQLIGGTGITVDTAKGIVTITNAGVTSITGTANQVIASASTGAVTLSTPQSIGTSSSPTFAALTLSSQLTTPNGGTGIVSPTIHKLLIGNGASAMTQLGVGATNTVLHGNTAADPTWAAIGTSDVGDSTITAVKIAASAIDLAKQVYGQLPTANIADSSVTAVKIATGAVSLTKQVSGQLPTANIADSNVTAVKIATGAVSLTKQVSGILPIANGGTSAATANAALKALTPDSTAQTGKALGIAPGGGYAWITPGFASPMTTTGDLLYSSDNSGTAARRAIGTSGQVLTVSGGLPVWATFSALTNPMTTTGDIIISSSGSTPDRLAVGTAAQFLIGGATPAWGSTLLAAAAGLGTTSTDGLVLKDSTAATVGVTSQWSPRLRFTGSGWKSNATAASQTDDWIVENQPATGTTSSSSKLVFSSQINGGGYTPRASFGSDGALYLGASQVLTAFALGGVVTGSSLTSVGTLTSGTWHATPITEVYGGTGQTSYVSGDLLYASGTTTLTTLPLGPANALLESIGGAPNWVAPLNPYGFVFGSSAGLTVGVTSGYFSPFGASQTSAVAEDATHEMLVVSPCQATNLYLQVNAGPGGGNTHTMQMYRSTNKGSTWNVTPLAVTIANSATSAQDVADTVSLNAGDLITLEDHSSVASSATSGTWGMHLIEPTNISGVYNTVTASSYVTTDQLKTIAATDTVQANSSNSYTSASVATYAGRVAVQNNSGGTTGTITATIKNSKITASSVIIATVERDANSAAGVEYIANSSGRVAGTSFQVLLHKATTSPTASFNNLEGCTLNYIVIN